MIVLVVGWSAASWVLGSGRLPGPLESLRLLGTTIGENPVVAAQGGGSWGYSIHVLSTFWHVLAGASGGMIIGCLGALLAAQSSLSWSVADTLLEAIRTVPPLIVVPFAAIALSGSNSVQLVSVALYAALMMAVYTFNAIENIPLNYVQLATLLGASRLRRMANVQIPAMLPRLLGPVRVVLAFSLGISVVAEYLASPTGIGRVMKFAMAYSDVHLIVVGVLWTVIIAFVYDAATVLFFGFFMRWTGRRQLVEWMAR